MTTLLNSEIKYDRETRDYAVYINGELIGYGANYSEAEQVRTAALAQQPSGEDYYTAKARAELPSAPTRESNIATEIRRSLELAAAGQTGWEGYTPRKAVA